MCEVWFVVLLSISYVYVCKWTTNYYWSKVYSLFWFMQIWFITDQNGISDFECGCQSTMIFRTYCISAYHHKNHTKHVINHLHHWQTFHVALLTLTNHELCLSLYWYILDSTHCKVTTNYWSTFISHSFSLHFHFHFNTLFLHLFYVSFVHFFAFPFFRSFLFLHSFIFSIVSYTLWNVQ